MHLHIKNNSKFINCFYSETIHGLNKAILKIDNIDNKISADLYCNKEKISCNELQGLKELLLKSNIRLTTIFSSSRESIITAQSLKINGVLSQNNLEKFNSIFKERCNSEDITKYGMVRSGEQISSNGNLFIVGDVNPGAQISAKKNIYVWGKLCGVAFAGKNGKDDSTISSLYLNAVQLRINKTVAIGPKEKPKNNYPEIALLENGKIVIKPLIINS